MRSLNVLCNRFRLLIPLLYCTKCRGVMYSKTHISYQTPRRDFPSPCEGSWEQFSTPSPPSSILKIKLHNETTDLICHFMNAKFLKKFQLVILRLVVPLYSFSNSLSCSLSSCLSSGFSSSGSL